MPEIVWALPDGQQLVGTLSQTIVNASDLTGVAEVAAGATGTKTATTSLSATPLGSLTLALAIRPSGTVTPPPVDPGLPSNTVTIGSLTHSLDGVNPGSTGGTGGDSGYPGYRGPNQLIYYSNPTVTTTATNQWGVEVVVNGTTNVVESVNDRQASGSTSGTAIASGRYVLSGHGTSRDWLLTNATVGATISFTSTPNPDPTPTPDPTPSSAYPTKAISIYKMMWSSSESFPFGSVPSQCNVIRLAFGQGNPPSLVGWGPEGQSSFLSAAAAWRTSGKKIIWSFGGQGGAINTSNRSGFMSSIASLKATLQGAGADLDGIDWDIEASSLNQSDVVWISTQCKAVYGSGFAITFVPNGGNVSQYLPAAVACQQAGALDEYGQQFYDAPVSLSAAMGRISQAIGAGIPQSKMSVGMMIANDANHWTNQQCRDYMASIRQTYPGITKAYLWWGARSGTAQWASDMKAVIG